MRHRRLQHVRAGSRHAGLHQFPVGDRTWNRASERKRELVNEVRIGLREVKGDRPGRIVGHDGSGEIAPLRLLRTGFTADESRVEERSVTAELEDTLMP